MKKIFTMLCALVLSVTLFAGCNLTTLNKSKYYKTVVVTVDGGEDYKVYNKEYTREDVLNAFYNYSYSNVSNGYMTAEAGLESAVDSMIDRDLLVNYIKANYFDTGEPDSLTLTQDDIKSIRYEAFKYMQDQIYDYEDEVREEWDRVLTYDGTETEEEEEDTSLRAEYTPYTPSFEVEYIDGKLYLKNAESETDSNVKFDVPEKFDDFRKKRIVDEDVSAEAYARYVSALQKTAKSFGKSTKEEDVINAEIERLTNTLTQNKYITKYQDWFNKTQKFDKKDVNSSSIEVLKDEIIDQVIEEYTTKYNSQKQLYDGREDAYHTAMADDATSVYYHPDYGDGCEYMYVTHILIKFNDATQTKVENLKAELKSGKISEATYNTEMDTLLSRISVTYEEDGKTKTSSAENVIAKVKNYVNNNASDDDVVKRAELFNDMIYMFNDDEGMMNRDYAYVVNLDGVNVEDQMVKEFADACRELNDTDGIGGITDVVSEYGIHIIFHAGYVTSIDPNTAGGREALVEALINQKTQLSSSKTMFNVVYNNLTFASADTRAEEMVEQAKGYVNIVIYPKKYKSLLNN